MSKPESRDTARDLLLDYGEVCGEYLDVAQFIAEYREPSAGPLDIRKTAAKLGIPFSFSDKVLGHAEIKGLDDIREPIEILVDIHDNEPAMSFAHEVGHYFLFTQNLHMADNWDEEVFCEAFGRMMSMPCVSGLDAHNITGEYLATTATEYSVSISQLVLWLMEQKVLPVQLIVDSKNPDYPNPDYSHKISRHIVCLSCEYQTCSSAKFRDHEDSLPLLNLTDHELGGSFGMGHMEWLRPGDPEFESLQRKYMPHA